MLNKGIGHRDVSGVLGNIFGVLGHVAICCIQPCGQRCDVCIVAAKYLVNGIVLALKLLYRRTKLIRDNSLGAVRFSLHVMNPAFQHSHPAAHCLYTFVAVGYTLVNALAFGGSVQTGLAICRTGNYYRLCAFVSLLVGGRECDRGIGGAGGD